MREQYIAILGLPPQATIDQIKKRYRELVMRYHPDLNKDEGATEQFLKIQHAYEKVMGDDPDLMRIVASYKPRYKKSKNPKAARAEFIRQRMDDYLKNREKEAEEIEVQMFETLTHGWIYYLTRLLGFCSVFFALIMLADYVVAPVRESDEVKAKAYFEHFQRNTIFLVNSNAIDVPENVFLRVKPGDTFSLRYSGITHEFEAWEVKPPNTENSLEIENEFNFFTFFPLFPILFLIPGLILFYRKNTTAFYILYLVTLIPFPALMLHYGLREQKFAHIFNYFFGG